MDVFVYPFPLFNLSFDVQINVLRNMDSLQQIGFSTLSKRTKDLVKCLNIEPICFRVIIGEIVSLMVWFNDVTRLVLRFHSSGCGNLVAKFDDCPWRFGKWGFCCVYDHDGVLLDNQSWKYLRFNIREWINHFQIIFHKPKIDELSFRTRIDQYDIDSLRMTIGGLNIKELNLSFEGFHNYSDMIMETFKHLKTLVIGETPFRDINKILMGNFSTISLASSSKWTLDHLLICNSSRLVIHCASFSDRVLNQFLKHWVKGSNPRMSFMLIQFEQNRHLDQNVILKGLEHYVVPPDQERKIGDFYIKGGFDIQRKDNGTKATIGLYHEDEDGEPSSSFQLDIWE